MRSLYLLTILFIVLALPVTALARPYQKQAPEATVGQFKISLEGPAAFIRIDGLDRNLDDILLATQAPSAAVLAIYAEPAAWNTFQRLKETGIHCHALISTPAPMAAQTISTADFRRIKDDLSKNMKASVKKERRLEGELGGVSDHQVEQAKGIMESFTVLEDQADFLTYQVISSLELKYKNSPAPRVSRSITVSSTTLIGGKIINLQLVADPQGPGTDELAELARAWRETFINRNTIPLK